MGVKRARGELWPEVAFTPADIKALAKQLAYIRLRGILNVDYAKAPSKPTKAPIMDFLAGIYAQFKDHENEDRAERFRRLIWDVTEEYGQQKRTADSAAFIRALFFDPDDPEIPVDPDKLKSAVMKSLKLTESTFKTRRIWELEEFSKFLSGFINREIGKQNERIQKFNDRIEKDERKDKERAEKAQAKKERQEQQLQLLLEEEELEQQRLRDKAAKAPMRYASIVILTIFALVPIVALMQSQISTHQAEISHAWSALVQWIEKS
ncbi:hypothetical protein AB0E08_17895 [Streptomyces sp. NPDC048281]|uniref:hypothetical protein n=1 Tax=Streptomyces sp. NPDC048281 TaxID=3154715 RepID=UPI003438709F